MYYAEKGIKDFHAYLSHKGIYSEFNQMDAKNKEKILMKYKWGGSVHDHNMDAESTRKFLVAQVLNAGVETITGDEQGYWKNIIKTEDYFHKLKKEFGILPQEVKKIEQPKELVSWTD